MMNNIQFLNVSMLMILVLLIAFHVTSCAEDGSVHASKSSQNSSNPYYNLKMFKIKNNIYNFNNGSNTTSNFSNNGLFTTQTNAKRWQVGRVSRKQYEIVNMLWRKTKVFEDTVITTNTNKRNTSKTVDTITQKCTTVLQRKTSDLLKVPISRLLGQSSTPSYIEFYYLDDADEQMKQKKFRSTFDKQSKDKRSFHIKDSDKKIYSHIFAFHVNDPLYKRSTLPNSKNFKLTDIQKHEKMVLSNIPLNLKKMDSKIRPTFSDHNKNNSVKNKTVAFFGHGTKSEEQFINNRTCSTVKRNSNKSNKISRQTYKKSNASSTLNVVSALSTTTTATKSQIKPSTVHDRIKFFEIYDKQSENYDLEAKFLLSNNDIRTAFMDANQNQKVLLEHVDQNIRHHNNSLKLRYVKKDIHSYFHNITNPNDIHNEVKDFKLKVSTSFPAQFVSKAGHNFVGKEKNTTTIITNPLNGFLNNYSKKSRPVLWTDYPFVAVYIHEPSQVFCDAAALSPHWLLAAASCLSRHRKGPQPEARSAFVTYCGGYWWQPKRVAYVKYSLVHPHYHPEDRKRRYQYNIGLIQVASSMSSACPGWSPISLMSHQFTSKSKGSIASAIGWGLDRYGTRYESKDLPKRPIIIYEGLVNSDSCPGNIGYRKAKKTNAESVKNVYCLSLPPYYGEENDPVHGGVLLVGGKLIALYLQEERRGWGAQSAEYTGVWRLIPWVHNTAHEPEELDSLDIEI